MVAKLVCSSAADRSRRVFIDGVFHPAHSSSVPKPTICTEVEARSPSAANHRYATRNGLIRATSSLIACAASQRSTARCALSQNSAEFPEQAR